MKKRLLSIFAMVCVTLGMQAAVGDDLTTTYLQNADFSQDTPVEGRIYTYDYDMPEGGLFGQQAVTGWTALNLSNNIKVMESDKSTPREDGANSRAAGVFGIGQSAELGGAYYCPESNFVGQKTGNALGLVAVWGAKLQYTQAVTLPAGCYTLKFAVANTASDGTVSANLMGFIADDGTSYVVNKKSWLACSADMPEWSTDEVTFMLDKETSGVISIGYTSTNSGSSTMPHLFVDYVKIEEGDAVAFDLQKAAVLKETLAELIEQAEDMSIDVTAYQAIYDNPDATSAQVQAAIDELRQKIATSMTDFTDFFINNAHFAIGTPMDNGVCTYDYDMAKNNTTYYGMQPIPEWTALTPTDNTLVSTDSGSGARKDGKNAGASGLFAVGSPETVWLGSDVDKVPATKANGSTEGNVFGFISVWSKNSYYYQDVTLPAGSYTITIPTYNERGTGAIKKNMCGFIAEDDTEYLATTTTFPVGVWKEETIKFKLEDETSGRIVIGYEAADKGSNDMPHLFIDEFLLKFNGKTDMDPSLIALNSAIRAGEAMLDTDEKYEAALTADLMAAMQTGKALKDAGSSDQAANTAAATAINSAVGAIRASITVYKNFRNFIDGKLLATIEKYMNGDLSDFADELIGDREDYDTAWDDGTYTTAQINEIINGFDARVIAAVKDAFETASASGQAANLDITCLFADKNLGYDKSTVEGWTKEGTGGFESTDQVAQIWSGSAMDFTVYQTLNDLPAGVYEIQAPGFYREGANDANCTAWQNEEISGFSYIFAGNNRTLMHNVMEYAAPEADDYHTAQTDGGYVYNNKTAAHYAFTVAEEAMNTVTGVLVATGDLKIGVKGENIQGNGWTVWEGFTVIYKGTDGMEAALADEVAALSGQASDLAEDLNGAVLSAEEKLGAAIIGAGGVSASSSIDDLVAAINALNEAIAYGNESKKLLSDIEATYFLYSNLMDEVESDDNNYFDLISEVDGAMEDYFEDNEAITTYINRLKDEWATFVQYDVLATATEAAPADISAAILNRGFEGTDEEGLLNPQDEQSGAGNGAYWDKNRKGGNDFGYQYGIYESYNTDWFEISQTIKGLAAGYYKVTVQGFYREGSNQDNANAFAGDSLKTYVSLFANDYSVKLNNQLENGTNGEKAGIGEEPAIEYNGSTEYYVPNNREALAAQFEDLDLYHNELVCKVDADGVLKIGICKKTGVTGDWCPFDNFKLFYIGTTISEEPVINPTAIEAVEVENAANTVIFDLAGRRVAKAVKGIYIINGKKVVK